VPGAPFERVIDAQLGALGARVLVGVVAERFAQPAVDGGPVALLGREADDADVGAGALGGGQQPDRVLV
jgi:hypothetical protein